jgi:addiction module HigA family antidote
MANKMAPKNQYIPQTVSHPGTTLEAKIQEMEMSVSEFAVRAGKPEETILAVIRGESSITPELAVIFEDITQIPAHFWIARQRNYDDAIARKHTLQRVGISYDWANP